MTKERKFPSTKTLDRLFNGFLLITIVHYSMTMRTCYTLLHYDGTMLTYSTPLPALASSYSKSMENYILGLPKDETRFKEVEL